MSKPLSILAELGVQATGLTADSRQVEAGSVFLAYPGEHNDGRQFITQAIRQGAAAVLWERTGYAWNKQWQVPNLAVEDLRRQAGNIADEFYGHPSRQLWMIGVTGTNGKTSCSHWLAQALTSLGRKAAVVGTLGNGFPNALSAAINTTPDPILLHGMLAGYLAQQATAVAMEVSSHGLDQGRVNGVHFDVAVFTNLSRDHLDYHGDMQTYAAAKKKLFQWQNLNCAVLNADDDFGRQIAQELAQQDKRLLTYGFAENGHHCDVRASELQFSERGLAMQVDTPFGRARLQAALLGRFNAYNLLAVLSALLASGIELRQAVAALGELQPVAGRMQQLGGGEKPLVVIDYAHTPDALEKVLATLAEQLRASGSSGRLICVFGCGGNRDAGKRPLMGEIASRLADTAIVTSDNPRDENPADIIAAIENGMQASHEVQPDRALAIAQALNMAQTGDIVLIAGKGHEDYQEVAGIKHPFSDRDVALQALHAWRAAA